MTETKPITRTPSATIRLRAGRKNLRHGLRQGWRTTDGVTYPVTTTRMTTLTVMRPVTRATLGRAA